MKIIHKESNRYVIKIENGEEVMGQLVSFCEQNDIKAATLSFLGAVNETELWWYDTSNKRYEKKVFSEQMEIACATGNVATSSDGLVVHIHGVFSGRDYSAIAGHINKAVVSGACEVTLDVLSGEMRRDYDEDTGLKLLQ